MDNLAGKLDDMSLNNNSSSKSNVIYLNPHQKRIQEIRKTIDALLDIRLKLSMSKLLSDKMNVEEFNRILDEQKDKEKDELVSKEIDELFKDIIPINKETAISMVDKEIEKHTLSLEELENEMKQNYKEDSGMGNSKRLNNGHYRPEKKVEE